MKNSTLAIVFVAAVLFLARQTIHAELSIGDPAPKLQVGKWIQGDPVSGFDSNHVYVVEFWATWCGPCRESIPHLNELAKKFADKGVVFIGQDVADSDDAVAPFVKKMGDKMTYRVALDDKTQIAKGVMETTWMKAAGQNGIPTAFIINKQGIIAWISHPMGLEEKTLNDILSGQYDIPKAAAEYKKAQEENRIYQEKNEKIFAAINQKKWDDAQSALDDFLKDYPRFQNSYESVRFQILLGQKKYDTAYQFVDSFAQAHPTDYNELNSLAWTIATGKNIEPRNLPLAQKLAEQAVAASKGKNSSILDTLARIQFMLGDKEKAIATEQKAVAVASDDEAKEICQKTLAAYQQGKLPDEKN